ncbi:MAG TPA: membrane-anchored protein [Cyanobacteria bacterium UBA11372]|nr:membrane-anchored protein [Cyanobacteria bacterium UBA11372]
MSSDAKFSQSMPSWRLWLPLVFQTALIISVPAGAIFIHLTGKTAILQTAPLDPDDLLRGYSQTLSYDISRRDTLEKLPGWKELTKNRRSQEPIALYVILEAPETQISSGRPLAWRAVKVSSDRPINLPLNQVVLKGVLRYGSVTYGVESYYFPEQQRQQLNDDINQAQSNRGQQEKAQPFVVEVKVDAEGNAVPVSLWVRDRNYRF